MHRLEVKGKPPTLNSYYSGKHWSVRKRDADEWHTIFYVALRELVGLPERLKAPFTVNVTQFCKRMPRDADNCVLVSKFFCDALVLGKWIDDDDYKTIPTVILNSRKGSEDKIVITFG